MFSHFSRINFGALLLSVLLAGAANAEPWQIARSSGPVWFGPDATQLVSLGPNSDVPAGATVVTGVGGRAMLVHGAQTMLVGPNAVVTVPDGDSGGITTILQRAGEVTFDVDRQKVQHFAVETPFLAAVVKGTNFTVNVESGSTAVSVGRGLVEVTDLATGEKVDTAAGQHAAVNGRGGNLDIGGSGLLAVVTQGTPRAPIVAPLSDAALQSLQNKARTGDGTGLHEVRSEGAGLAVVAGNSGGTGSSGGPSGGTGGTGGDALGDVAGSANGAAGNVNGAAALTTISYGGSSGRSSEVSAVREGVSPLTFALGAALLTLFAVGLAFVRGAR